MSNSNFHHAITDLFHTMADRIGGQTDARGEESASSRNNGEDVDMNQEMGLEAESVLPPQSTDTPNILNTPASAQTPSETDAVMLLSNDTATTVAIDAHVPPAAADEDDDARSDQSMPHLEDVSDSDDDDRGANFEQESFNGSHRHDPAGADGSVDVADGSEANVVARIAEDLIVDDSRRVAVGGRSSSGPQGTRRARVEDDAEGDSERDRRHPSQRTSTPINSSGTRSSGSSTPNHTSTSRSTPVPAAHNTSPAYPTTHSFSQRRTVNGTPSNGVPAWTFGLPQPQAQQGLEDEPTHFDAFIDFIEGPPGSEPPPGIPLASLFDSARTGTAGGGTGGISAGFGPNSGFPQAFLGGIGPAGMMGAIPVGGVPGVGFGAAGPLPPHPHPHPHIHVHAPHARAHGNPGQNGTGSGPTRNPAPGGTERHPFAEFLARFGNALREAAQRHGNAPDAESNANAEPQPGVGGGDTNASATTPTAPAPPVSTTDTNPGNETIPNAGPQAQAQVPPGQQQAPNRLSNFLQSLIEATGGDGNFTTTAMINGIPVNLGGTADGNAAGANNNNGNVDGNADNGNGNGTGRRRPDRLAAFTNLLNAIANRGHIHGGAFAFDPATGGFAGGFPLFGFRPAPERDDPERARRLVDGLEEVPVGLVRRLERVARESKQAGLDGSEGGQGDGGCAICWERLIEDDEVLLKMQEEEEAKKEKEREEREAKERELKEQEMKEKAAVTDEDMQMESPTEVSSSSAAPTSSSADTSTSVPSSSTASSSSPSSSSSQKKHKTPKYPRIVALPCAHVFHADCLIPWFSRPRQTTCPTCRFNIDPEGLTRHMGPSRRATATPATGAGARGDLRQNGSVPGAAQRARPANLTDRTSSATLAPGVPPTGEPTEAMGGGIILPGVLSGGWFGPTMTSPDDPAPAPAAGRSAFTPAAPGFTTTGPQNFSASSITPIVHSTPNASSAPAGSSTSAVSGGTTSSAANTTGSGDATSGASSSSTPSDAPTVNSTSSIIGSAPTAHNNNSNTDTTGSSGRAPPTQAPGSPPGQPPDGGQWLTEEQARSLAQSLFGAIFGATGNPPRQDQGARPQEGTASAAPQATAQGVNSAAAGPTPNLTQNPGPVSHFHAHPHIPPHHHHHHLPHPPDAHDHHPNQNGFLTIGFDLIIGSGPRPPGAIPLGQFMGDIPGPDGMQANRGANGNSNVNATGGARANDNGGISGNTNTGAQNGPGSQRLPTAAGGTGTSGLPTGIPGVGLTGTPVNLGGAMGLAVPLDMNGFGLGVPPFDMQPMMDFEDLRDLRDIAVDMADDMEGMGDDIGDMDEGHEGEPHIHAFGIDVMDIPFPPMFNPDALATRGVPRSEPNPAGRDSSSTSQDSMTNPRNEEQSQSQSQSQSRSVDPTGSAPLPAQQDRSHAYHVFPPWVSHGNVSSTSMNNPSSQQPQPPSSRESVRQPSTGTADGGSQPNGNTDPNNQLPETEHPFYSDYISTMLGRAMQGVARPPHAHAHAGPIPPRPPPMGPHVPRERRTWVPPPPPGLTLRQRIEKSEREAGLRCWDPSCGVGPSDEDPFVRIDDSQRRQVRVREAAAESASLADPKGKGKEKEKEQEEKEIRYICTHVFHPPCLVSAQRVALNGAKENIVEGGRSVEVSCPVCRAAGVVSKEDWEEGVRALQSS